MLLHSEYSTIVATHAAITPLNTQRATIVAVYLYMPRQLYSRELSIDGSFISSNELIILWPIYIIRTVCNYCDRCIYSLLKTVRSIESACGSLYRVALCFH